MSDGEREVDLLRLESAWLRRERDELRRQVRRLCAFLEANCIDAETGVSRYKAKKEVGRT